MDFLSVSYHFLFLCVCVDSCHGIPRKCLFCISSVYRRFLVFVSVPGSYLLNLLRMRHCYLFGSSSSSLVADMIVSMELSQLLWHPQVGKT